MPRTKGFTLIELLIVVVVIGILVAISIPKFANSKDKAHVAAMKSDLRNLATVEESFAADSNGAYFAGDGTAQGFASSQGVVVNATVNAGSPVTWSATASHAVSGRTCALSTGGVISCT